MKKQRVGYFIGLIVLLALESLIAIYVHDQFIRPYIGDILVVIVIYCMIKVIVTKRHIWIPLWIFIFAVFIEVLQYLNVVEILGLGDNKFFKIIIGATFDWKDIICYGIGCFLIATYEWFIRRKNKYKCNKKASITK